jgi:hypothetical protein
LVAGRPEEEKGCPRAKDKESWKGKKSTPSGTRRKEIYPAILYVRKFRKG